MKDLYLQLGIDPNASPADIEAALQAKPELGEAAAVLLDGSRRSAYNRTVSTIRSIGMLRHRLGLDAEFTWFVKTCPDFAPRLHLRKYVPPPESPAETVPEVAIPPSPGARKSKTWLIAALLIFAVAALLALSRTFL
jgi:hypothetical protein